MKNDKKPVAMPKAEILSTFGFMKMFPDEKSAVAFVEKVVWANNKPICPKCGSDDTSPRVKQMAHRCRMCRWNFTVRMNTIFENSRLPLRKWLYGMYILQTARKGISSMQLSKELEITQKASWFMLHRLRDSCDLGSIKLNGIVEVDETFIGGKESNRHEHKKLKLGTGGVGKVAVIGARERGGKTIAKVIKRRNMATLQGFVGDNVDAGSNVITDDFRSYIGLDKKYDHATVNHTAKEYVNGMAHTNGMESVWAVMKRGYNGVYHNWSMKHTQRYINEFAFRLNEGNCGVDTVDRMKSLITHTVGKSLTYKELTQ